MMRMLVKYQYHANHCAQVLVQMESANVKTNNEGEIKYLTEKHHAELCHGY
jgi:hypothetical protein